MDHQENYVHWCYIDGSWKKHDKFLGKDCSPLQGRHSKNMWSMRILHSLPPLHAEMWSLDLSNGMLLTEVMFAADCFELVKMMSAVTKWPAFTPLMEEIHWCKAFFPQFSLQHILGAKIQWRTNFHEVLEISFQLCTMLVLLLQFGFTS